MNLHSLLLSSDNQTTRMLRRVLGGLEITLEHCHGIDSAIRELTRRRFQAIILDCEDEHVAARMPASVRSSPCNVHAMIATIQRGSEPQPGLADFVLYKPLSFAKAQRTFRAARYLMKCECRRTARVAVQFPVSVLAANGEAEQVGLTSDISEGGMAVRFRPRSKRNTSTRLRFTLPGTDHVLECPAELAWENAQSEAGFRFVDLTREDGEQLRKWLSPYCFDYQIPADSLMQTVLPGFAPATE